VRRTRSGSGGLAGLHCHLGDFAGCICCGTSPILRPHRAHHRDALIRTPPAFVKGGAESGEFGFEPADAGAEDQPPLGEFCNVASSWRAASGWRIGSTSTLVPSRIRSLRPQPKSGSARVKEQRRARERRARNDDVLADPDIVEPEILARMRRGEFFSGVACSPR